MAFTKAVAGVLGVAGVGGTALVVALERAVQAGGSDADRYAHSPSFNWPHNGIFASYDVKSIRRGYEVYKNVCAACHGCFTVNYRMLSRVCMTPEEAKAEAKRSMFLDGPDDEGKMFERPGTMVDYLPEPYPNDAAAAFANGGKAPPNLGLIVNARLGHGGEDYIYSLLTGYCDPPAGFKLEEGLHFNPYFPGGAIAMPPPLYNEIIEYSDGTPATKSQLAKDVTCFLRFASEPWHDDRKKLALKILPIMGLLAACCYVNYVHVWASTWLRRAVTVPKPKTR